MDVGRTPVSALPVGRRRPLSLRDAAVHAAAILLVGCAFLAELKGWGRGALAWILPALLFTACVGLRTSWRVRGVAVSACAGAVLLFRTDHAWLLIGLSALVLGTLDLCTGLAARWGVRRFARVILFLGSACFALILAETALMFIRATGIVDSPWILPAKFEIHRIDASRDYYWHGVLHRFNAQGFRGPEWPDPAQAPRERYRIVALGDSLTYGYGVEEDKTYPEDLRRRLGATHRVEVLNLGVSGNQSEQTLALAKRYLHTLRPDLVLYGHCLNDFLPAEAARYSRYDVPLPHRVKRMFRRRTLIGGLSHYGYGQLLIVLGLDADFYDDILKGIEGYDRRFARDVKELNDLAVQVTGRPVLALVLNQMPANTRGRKVARLAERRMAEGGMLVVPADPYQDEYASSGVSLKVSIWEGHPNALAHAIYAGEFAKTILAQPAIRRDLDRFRR